jgi:hypothetical protein
MRTYGLPTPPTKETSMATFTASAAQSNGPSVLPQSISHHARDPLHAPDLALSVGDVIQMCKVPNGAIDHQRRSSVARLRLAQSPSTWRRQRHLGLRASVVLSGLRHVALTYHAIFVALGAPTAQLQRRRHQIDIWLPTLKDANAACAAQIGADPTTTRIYACYNSDSHIIYAVEPTSFNDHFGLEVLGHEFWHALGATHPE